MTSTTIMPNRDACGLLILSLTILLSSFLR